MYVPEHLRRPDGWIQSSWRSERRVAFFAHPLTPLFAVAADELANYKGEERSSALISLRMQEVGLSCPNEEEIKSGEAFPGFLRWLSFPMQTPDCSQSVWIDFYIIPAPAHLFVVEKYRELAYGWVEDAVRFAVNEAKGDGVELLVGVGALTKTPTDYGARLLQENPEWNSDTTISVSHGNSGTSYLTFDMLRQCGARRGDEIVLLGACGSMGVPLSHLIATELRPRTLVLVGRGDEDGSRRRLERLKELKQSVLQLINHDASVRVVISQDARTACHIGDPNYVIYTTNLLTAHPTDVPEGVVIIDPCTPMTCKLEDDWSRHIVTTSGCGFHTRFDDYCPEGFGMIVGQRIRDIGCGDDSGWGCFLECCVLGLEGWSGRVVGRAVPLAQVRLCVETFSRYFVVSQLPNSFGDPLQHIEVIRFAGNRRVGQDWSGDTPSEGNSIVSSRQTLAPHAGEGSAKKTMIGMPAFDNTDGQVA